MNKSKKLNKNVFLRASIIISITVLVSVISISLAGMVFKDEQILHYGITQITILGGVLIAIIQLLVIFASKLANEWLISKKENEELKQAKLLSDYNLLKDRLNPHFLFNNLSVLKSLIHYNPSEAEVFTQNFTNVYRYVLKSHEAKLVSLQEELKFLESYIALHQERIGSGLVVDIKIDTPDYARKVPPLSMQLLVENAIKHNIANKQRPLCIFIYAENQQLIVKNTLNRKVTTYSTYTGLKTLRAQYKVLANQEIVVYEDSECFIVKLGLF
jgi:LytS/YehU family sensor histidine kinase